VGKAIENFYAYPIIFFTNSGSFTKPFYTAEDKTFL